MLRQSDGYRFKPDSLLDKSKEKQHGHVASGRVQTKGSVWAVSMQRVSDIDKTAVACGQTKQAKLANTLLNQGDMLLSCIALYQQERRLGSASIR